MKRKEKSILRQRIKAGLLIIIGVVLLVAMATYHATDAAGNTASGVVRNWLGYPGAYVADLLLQIMGWPALLIPAVFIVFGVFVWGQFSWVRLRAWLLIPAFLLACWLLGGASLAETAWTKAGAGGFVGFYLNQWGGVSAPWLVALLWFVVGGLVIFSFKIPALKMVAFAGKGVAKGAKKLPVRFPAISVACPKVFKRSSAPKAISVKIKKPSKKSEKTPTKSVARPQRSSAETTFELPSADLLQPAKVTPGAAVSRETMEKMARNLEEVLSQFGVPGKTVGANPGPVVTQYEFEPAAGVKSSRVIALADDVAREMRAVSARITLIPGSNTMGIEMPNPKREIVYIREMIENDAFRSHTGSLPLILGKDIGGVPVYTDLARMPHLLVAGTTGSGKSVSINTMILSILYRFTPAEVRLIMVDPKMVELSVYNDIPHLLTPVVTESSKAVVALKWAVREMENRYQTLSQLGVRNIEGYNQKLAEARRDGIELKRRVQTGFDPETGKPIIEEQLLDLTPLPYIVFIVDEMADLMGQCGKEAEPQILRLAAKARAIGIHLILATQRPSVDVITGTIKANVPTRISFQVRTKIDSRTILDESGAEQLLGKGDMLFMPVGDRASRVHGPVVTDDEVAAVAKHLKKQGEPNYVDSVTVESDGGGAGGGYGMPGEGGGDSLYDQAVAIVLRDKKPTTSYVQRKLSIGYNKAADLIDRMEAEGVVSAPNMAGKREILVPTDNG